MIDQVYENTIMDSYLAMWQMNMNIFCAERGISCFTVYTIIFNNRFNPLLNKIALQKFFSLQ